MADTKWVIEAVPILIIILMTSGPKTMYLSPARYFIAMTYASHADFAQTLTVQMVQTPQCLPLIGERAEASAA